MSRNRIAVAADAHSYRQDLIAVSRVDLDLGAQRRVPETDTAILPACQDVLGRRFCVTADVDCAFVSRQRLVQGPGEALNAPRRRHLLRSSD